MPTASLRSKQLVKKPWKDLTLVIMVALFFAAAALLLNHPHIQHHVFNIDSLRREMETGGLKSNLLFIVIGCLVNALGIPKLWICAAAGTFFGAIEGIVVALTATLIGASINFAMGRTILRGPVRRNIPRRLRHWYQAFNNYGFRAILCLRLFPLINATITNLLGGASEVRYRDYLAATIVGFLPFTTAFVLMGSSAAGQNGWQFAGGLVLLVALGGAQWGWSAYNRKKKSRWKQVQDLPQQPQDLLTGREAK